MSSNYSGNLILFLFILFFNFGFNGYSTNFPEIQWKHFLLVTSSCQKQILGIFGLGNSKLRYINIMEGIHRHVKDLGAQTNREH